MSVDPTEVRRKVSQRAAYADEDLSLARHGLTLESEVPYRLIAYHAQQCAEKYLKAYLVSRGVDFPYTHNIARLVELCAAPSPMDWDPFGCRGVDPVRRHRPLPGGR